MSAIDPPMALLAELTHRCPLQCPYCSNPLELERVAGEMRTEEWLRALREAADIGCMQVHFSGGEPTVRIDLEELVAGATEAGLYSNLITSGVLLDAARLERLVAAGLEHVQLSFQDSETTGGDRIGGYRGGHEKKIEVAALVRAAGLPLTANFVVHRQNVDHLEAMIDLAVEIGAHRTEIANVQYYGWALKNRAALMPSRAQLDRMTEIVEAARVRLKGVLVIDYVVPDYYAQRPKSCMGGWGRRFLNISPSGKRCCPATRLRRSPIWNSTMSASAAWLTSGGIRMPSTASGVPTGCLNRVGRATGGRSIGAAAAVRPSLSRAMPPRRIRHAACRKIMQGWSRLQSASRRRTATSLFIEDMARRRSSR